MEAQQRVIRRNWIFWRLLVCLAVVAALLFLYTVVQQNLSTGSHAGPIEIMDIQSATASLLATGGALLARAQYATAVRPMIGFQGRPVRGPSPDPDQLVWAFRMLNGGQDAATVTGVRYCVRRQGADPAGPAVWLELDAVHAELERAGLRADVDYGLLRFGAGFPLSGHQHFLLGWFTPGAMAVVDAFGVRIEVEDRVGDLHGRSIDVLKGAHRNPRTDSSDW